ncbi:hypothetical protein F7734_49115 [Scytonema sp. UIC 10036]|uniref:hypothetical protein n=1 Tax=Scytonema sp. UIC 10036 TaxID=2304196 RepID=UPI0012DA3071|nr:hypothetical protein [Scytonema sp. UIC 10036]MUG99816.1 hypothetical protein [Scytonema sp. UIC 10036]
MLQPFPHKNNDFKCYLWALLHSSQLIDFGFYPRIWKSSKARRFIIDFGLIQGFIYIHSLELDFFIPDEVWVAYLSAYGIPQEKQRDYYLGCPF